MIGGGCFLSTGVAMCFSTFRLFVFIGFGTLLCLSTILLESIQAQESEKRFNFWERTKSGTPRREVPQATEDEYAKRISQSFQREIDPETRQQGWGLLYYGIFLVITAVIAAGFVGWKVWRQHRLTRELTDPVFLINELNFAHQLSEQEKRLMQELSEKHSLPSPLKLFVEPKFLLDALASETFTPSRPTIQQLLSKLFDIVKA